MPNLYAFGGALVETSIPFSTLAGFVPAPGKTPDLQIKRARNPNPAPSSWTHHWRLPDGSTTLSFARDSAGCHLRVPGLCDLLLSPDARRILAWPAADLQSPTLEHLLIDQVLPRWLALRGDMVLHAALAGFGDAGAIFLGDSGAGKSTLTAYLHAAGHPVWSDDAVVLVDHAAGVHASATYPSIRLSPEAHAHVFGAGGPAPQPMAQYSDKVRVPLGGSGRLDSCAVRAIYVLAPATHDDANCQIARLPPSEACILLLRQAFAMDLRDRVHMAALLAFHGRLAATVPVFTLSYPRRYEAMASVLARLRRHQSELA